VALELAQGRSALAPRHPRRLPPARHALPPVSVSLEQIEGEANHVDLRPGVKPRLGGSPHKQRRPSAQFAPESRYQIREVE
jgi:hypothetical protein